MRMIEFLSLVAHILVSPFKTRARLQAEIIVLRHQVNVLRRRLPPKPRLTVADRLIFVWLYWLFPSVRSAIAIIQPETVVRWHRGVSVCTGAGSLVHGAVGRSSPWKSAA